MRIHALTTLAAVVSVLCLASLCTQAEDWPNWRGPHHNGIAYDVNWIDEGVIYEPNILWEQYVGTGFSSMSLADGRLFTMGNTGIKGDHLEHEHQDVLYCLDPNTGAILWSHAYPSILEPKNYEGGPSATPSVADCNVYTLSKFGMAYCLDANDGTVLWENDLVANFGVRRPTWGFAGSPFIEGNTVIYNAGTHGLALRAVDGSLAWETGTLRPGYGTPVPLGQGERRSLVIVGEKTFAAVAPLTGEVLWEHPWVTRYQANITDPIVDGNTLFISTGYKEGAALFDIDVNTATVSERWFQPDMQTWLNTAVLWEGHLYGANDNGGTLTCITQATGRIRWAERGFGNGSLMLVSGRLLALSEYGELRLIEASPSRYQELAAGQILNGKCWTVPILAHGKIYARNAAGDIVCVALVPRLSGRR